MDKTEAKTWSEIPKEKLQIVMPNLAKHYDVLKAYADGYEIQCVTGIDKLGKPVWVDDHKPDFACDHKYRIKPNIYVGDYWAPRLGDVYYFVTETGEVVDTKSKDDHCDKKRIKFKNCFKTMVEAEFASKRILETLLRLKKDHIE